MDPLLSESNKLNKPEMSECYFLAAPTGLTSLTFPWHVDSCLTGLSDNVSFY